MDVSHSATTPRPDQLTGIIDADANFGKPWITALRAAARPNRLSRPNRGPHTATRLRAHSKWALAARLKSAENRGFIVTTSLGTARSEWCSPQARGLSSINDGRMDPRQRQPGHQYQISNGP
jgi:hypothetical protein